MKVGESLLLRAQILDIESTPHGCSIKVHIEGFAGINGLDQPAVSEIQPLRKESCVDVWMHRIDTPQVMAAINNTVIKVKCPECDGSGLCMQIVCPICKGAKELTEEDMALYEQDLLAI